MNYKRKLDLVSLLKKNSFFLFGPRGTGKSYWIKQTLPNAKLFNLLDADTFEALLRRPKSMSEQIQDPTQIVVIDEIQKLPHLLDEVHRLIEDQGIKFLLTGSSARKLKRGGANLLAGRAWEAQFFPLTYPELDDFDLIKYINYGGLPRVWNSAEPLEELKAYVRVYLYEEIKAEALVRSYERFVRFLETMAVSNGQEINYQMLASDSGVPPRTLEGYIEILEDTLIGYKLLPFQKTKKRKAATKSKFFLFDIGVTHHLKGIHSLTPGNTDFGTAFEHFIINEVRASQSYFRNDSALYYWRTKDYEVDLILDQRIAIEIKSSEQIKDSFFHSLHALQEEKLIQHYYLVSRCPQEGIKDGIQYVHYKTFLKRLWNQQL